MDRMEKLDRRLCMIGLGAVRWRLALGEALERLGRVGGVRVLGFSSVAAYAVERCGYSGRWVEEARGLARRLEGLAKLQAALVAGEITWSMAQLVARHATGESEAELVAAARTSTVRAMKAALEPRRQWQAEPDEAPPRRTIETVVDVEDAWAFERARMIVEAVTGEKHEDVIVEAMLAETLTSILPPPGSGGEDLMVGIERAADGARWRAEGQRVRHAVEDKIAAAFEALAAPRGDVAADVAEVASRVEGDDPVALDAAIVRAAGELRTRDLETGRLLRVVLETGAWRAIGYSSFDRYVRERLGMSRAAAQAKMVLARRCAALPELAAALQDGRIGTVGATMIGRVADAETVAAWVARAAERTVKHLREEIDTAGLVARMSGTRGPLAPPDEATVVAVQEVERAVLAGEPAPALHPAATIRGVALWTEGEALPSPEEGRDLNPPIVAAQQMSVGPSGAARLGRVPLRVNVAPDVADLWMAVREMFERRCGKRRSFVAALSDNIMQYWTPETGEDRPFEDVYRRDRYRCASPTCDRREVGAHHVVFRAHGGSDAADNLVSLCGRCHVDGVHGGHIRVVGRAPGALRWDLGRIVTVVGRCR